MRARTVAEFNRTLARNEARSLAAVSALWPMTGPLPEGEARAKLARRMNRAGNLAAHARQGAELMRRGARERGWRLDQCRGTLVPSGGAR